MILFLEDFRKYPNSIIHESTSNTSFLQLAEKLRAMGVKNYYFFLVLTQPELEFVDPHDPNITEEQIAMVAAEVKRNPWYFFREVARVPPQGGSPVGLPLRANRGNIALFWCFFAHIRPFLIQPRQTGKSLGTDLLNSYLLYIICFNTRINLLTKDNALRVANVERLKEIRGYLPPYLQARDKTDSDNTIEVECNKRNNVYTTCVPQNSEAGANNVGRGLTAPITTIDEGPFCPFIKTTLSAMLASGTAAREEAEQFGTPYGTIFTTTAGKKDDPSGKYMFDLLSGGMPWTEFLYDATNERELHAIVEKNSPGLMPLVNITLSHRQLGYTDKWLLKQLRDNNSQGEAADRDFFNKWTSGGLSSPLPTALNDRLRKAQRDPKHVQISKDNYLLRWYIPLDEIQRRMSSGTFVMGMDTSEGVGKDSITMVIMDTSTLEVVAASNCSEANLYYFAGYMADLLIQYPTITVIPERKSSGMGLIDALIVILSTKGIDPFKRIYNLVVDDPIEYKEEFRQVQDGMQRRNQHFYDRSKRLFGFVTAGSGRHSRGALYSDTLLRAAMLCCDTANDKRLIDEITGLVSKNGRIDHSSDGHDDMVVAWLLGVWFLTSSKNLAFYGIKNALSGVSEYKEGEVHKRVLTPVENYDKVRQARVRLDIEDLLVSLRGTNDEMLALRLESRIKSLDAKLTEEYIDANSLDNLLSDASKQRVKRVQQQMRDRRFRHSAQSVDYY